MDEKKFVSLPAGDSYKTPEQTAEQNEVSNAQKKDLILHLTVSKATYLENAGRCAALPPNMPMDVTRKLRNASEAWEDAAHLCEAYLKELTEQR
jgi:hypothetical protein